MSDIDPVRVVGDLLISTFDSGFSLYLCNDGGVWPFPCSEGRKKTLLSFHSKDLKHMRIQDLDEDVRTPLVEEVKRKVNEIVGAFIENVKNVADVVKHDSAMIKRKAVYDVYLGEDMVPIGEASAVAFIIDGELKLLVKPSDGGYEELVRRLRELDELVKKLGNELRSEMEKYGAMVKTGATKQTITWTGGHLIAVNYWADVLVIPESMQLAISLTRDAQRNT